MSADAQSPVAGSFSQGRVGRAVASTVLGQGISVLQSLFLVPLFLQQWGVQGYGRWIAVTAAVSMLLLLDLGGQGFIGNALGAAFVKERKADFEGTLRQGLSLYLSIAAGALLLAAVIIAGAPWVPWSQGERAVGVIMAAATLQTIPAGVLAAVWRATGRYARGTVIGNTFRGIGLVLSFGALTLHVGPIGYAALQLVVGALMTVVCVVDVWRTVPAFRAYRFSLSDTWRSGPMLRGSLPFWLIALATMLNNQGISLVVSRTLGAAALSTFSTHKTLSGLLGLGTALLQPAIWVEFNFALAREEHDRAAQVLLQLIRLSVLFTGVGALALWMVAPLFYPAWTRRELLLEPGLFLVLCTQLLMSSGWMVAGWPMMASNQTKRLAALAVLNGGCTVLFALLATRLGGGLRSVAAASLFADLLFGCAAYPLVAARILRISPWALYAAAGRALGALLPLVLATWAVHHAFAGASLRLGAFAAAASFLVYPTLVLALGREGLRRSVSWVLSRAPPVS